MNDGDGRVPSFAEGGAHGAEGRTRPTATEQQA